MRTPNANEIVLLSFLACPQKELKRHSNTVYEWHGQYLEILSEEQMLRGKVPAPWYMKFEGWRIREMGKQATKVKKLKK